MGFEKHFPPNRAAARETTDGSWHWKTQEADESSCCFCGHTEGVFLRSTAEDGGVSKLICANCCAVVMAETYHRMYDRRLMWEAGSRKRVPRAVRLKLSQP